MGPAAGYSSNCSQGQQQVTAVTVASIIYCVTRASIIYCVTRASIIYCVTRASIIYCVTREYFQAVMSLAMMTEALARN